MFHVFVSLFSSKYMHNSAFGEAVVEHLIRIYLFSCLFFCLWAFPWSASHRAVKDYISHDPFRPLSHCCCGSARENCTFPFNLSCVFVTHPNPLFILYFLPPASVRHVCSEVRGDGRHGQRGRAAPGMGREVHQRWMGLLCQVSAPVVLS